MASEYVDQRPPTYTSERHRDDPPGSPPPSDSGTEESLVSAPSRPSSPPPVAHRPISRARQRPHSTQPYPSPQAAALASQGYIVAPYQTEEQLPSQQQFEPSLPSSASEQVHSHPHPPTITSTTKLQRSLSRSHPSVNATNYACILRKTPHHRRFFSSAATSSITGSYTLDPFLHIPPELLPPLNIRKNETEADRKNLRLEVENGGIDVDIHLVGELPGPVTPGLSPRTTLSLGLAGGSRDSTFPIVARIVSHLGFPLLHILLPPLTHLHTA